jgi:hypothetical protein
MTRFLLQMHKQKGATRKPPPFAGVPISSSCLGEEPQDAVGAQGDSDNL